MELQLLFVITLICSLGGIGFFIYSLLIIKRITDLFPSGSVGRKWNFIRILIFLFLGGYVVNIVFLAIGSVEIVLFMTAIVYIFGGLFVFIIIDLAFNTYKLILLESK